MAAKKSKPKSKKSKKKAAEMEAEVQREIRDAEDPALAKELLQAFENWETTTEFATRERKRTKELVEARAVAFREAMEVGHQTANDQLTKLTVCELRWQELEDARAERKEIGSAMRDQVKNARQKIKDLREELHPGPQLGLFGTPDIDNPPVPEDDDEDESDSGPTEFPDPVYVNEAPQEASADD